MLSPGLYEQIINTALNRELSWMEQQEIEGEKAEDCLRKTLKLLQEKINCI